MKNFWLGCRKRLVASGGGVERGVPSFLFREAAGVVRHVYIVLKRGRDAIVQLVRHDVVQCTDDGRMHVVLISQLVDASAVGFGDVAWAALGGEVEVPTLEGKTRITIPEGTQSGKTFRLRDKGIRNMRTHEPGDLYMHVLIETPVNLTGKQKELLRAFDESVKAGGDKHNPKTKGFFERVKNFFK